MATSQPLGTVTIPADPAFYTLSLTPEYYGEEAVLTFMGDHGEDLYLYTSDAAVAADQPSDIIPSGTYKECGPWRIGAFPNRIKGTAGTTATLSLNRSL